MSNFVLSYYGGKKPDSPEEGQRHMEDFKKWLTSLGEAVVNPGTPLGMSMVVSSDGIKEYSGSSPLTGFSIIEAENIEAALEMTKSCPFLIMGTINVAEVMEMQ